MMVVFALLVWWLTVSRQLVFRVLAACLAFIPGVLFGVAAVNKYYNYYQTWSAAIADLTGQGVQAPPGQGHGGSAGQVIKLLGNSIYRQYAEQQGATLRVTVHGPASGLTRTTYLYLPPQYFQQSYYRYRFPVIELLHGYPGAPQDWITVLGVNTILAGMLQQGRAKPAVLVMPDVNGGTGISLQCLDQVGGPQDATFLARDLPAFISANLRVWAPGRTWAVAGYSEGGYCAANLGLQYGHAFGYAGVMSGYFVPGLNKLSHPKRQVDPFGGSRRLRRRNTPVDELLDLPPGTLIPHFWIGTGENNKMDLRVAMIFRQQVAIRQPDVVLKTVPGGHQGSTWRILLSPMLSWLTQQLAYNVSLNESRAQKASPPHVAPHAGRLNRPPKHKPRRPLPHRRAAVR
jgi:enterochelin esterase-like enzyme